MGTPKRWQMLAHFYQIPRTWTHFMPQTFCAFFFNDTNFWLYSGHSFYLFTISLYVCECRFFPPLLCFVFWSRGFHFRTIFLFVIVIAVCVCVSNRSAQCEMKILCQGNPPCCRSPPSLFPLSFAPQRHQKAIDHYLCVGMKLKPALNENVFHRDPIIIFDLSFAVCFKHTDWRRRYSAKAYSGKRCTVWKLHPMKGDFDWQLNEMKLWYVRHIFCWRYFCKIENSNFSLFQKTEKTNDSLFRLISKNACSTQSRQLAVYFIERNNKKNRSFTHVRPNCFANTFFLSLHISCCFDRITKAKSAKEKSTKCQKKLKT